LETFDRANGQNIAKAIEVLNITLSLQHFTLKKLR